MKDEIQNKTITVSSVSDVGEKVKIKDHEGKTFNVWKNKKDGTPTQAYSQFLAMDLKVGGSAAVGFKEDQFDYQGKTVTSKVIISFRETNETPALPANGSQVYESKEDYSRRLGVHGFVNARLVNNTPEQVEAELDKLIGLEDVLEAKLKAVSNEPQIHDTEVPF